jgi:hypothetical protein
VNINTFGWMDTGYRPSLAADNTGYLYCSVGGDWYSWDLWDEMYFRPSQNDGATWGTQLVIGRSPVHGIDRNPRILCDDDGNVYAVYGGSNTINFKRSVDNGSNWTPYADGIKLVDGPPGLGAWFFAELDNYGFIHIVYRSTATGASEVYYLKIDILGNTVGPPEMCTPDDGWDSWIQSLAVVDEKLYIGVDEFTPILQVALDIKPGSCPNPLNVKPFQDPPDPQIQGNLSASSGSKGKSVLPVAVLGTMDLDVDDIDVSSLLLEGVAPLRHSYEDVAAPVEDGEECECTTAGPDGCMDLSLKFQKSEVAAALGAFSDGDEIALTLKGQLNDGTPFKGIDCVVIRAKKHDQPHRSGPDAVVLYPAVPNPFNPITRITYHLPRENFVTLAVFDVTGRLVERLIAGVEGAGDHVVEWDARGVSSGIYFYRIKVGDFTETRKMMLIK